MTRDKSGHHSAKTRAKAVRRYVDGETSMAIARDMGVSGASVLGWVRAAGVPVRTRVQAGIRRYPVEVIARAVARYQDGEGSLVIAREIGCADCTVREWVTAAGGTIRPASDGRRRKPVTDAHRFPAAPPPPPPPRPRLVCSAPPEPEPEDHEHGARVPSLLPVPEPSAGEVAIKLVRDDYDGSVRLVARALVSHYVEGTPQVEQRSWDASAADQWPRGLLALLASAVAPREKSRRGARYGE